MNLKARVNFSEPMLYNDKRKVVIRIMPFGLDFFFSLFFCTTTTDTVFSLWGAFSQERRKSNKLQHSRSNTTAEEDCALFTESLS